MIIILNLGISCERTTAFERRADAASEEVAPEEERVDSSVASYCIVRYFVWFVNVECCYLFQNIHEV